MKFVTEGMSPLQISVLKQALIMYGDYCIETAAGWKDRSQHEIISNWIAKGSCADDMMRGIKQ